MEKSGGCEISIAEDWRGGWGCLAICLKHPLQVDNIVLARNDIQRHVLSMENIVLARRGI